MLSLNLLASGATVTDLNASGQPTGDVIRFTLDPDVGTDTPLGAQITAAGLFTWTPAANQIGSFDITVIAIDQGTPALADAERFRVNVMAGVPPQIVASATALIYTENDPATAVDPALTVTDSDSALLSGASIAITEGFVSGQDILEFVDQNGITGSFNTSTGVLTLSGSGSVANYQTALRSVSYRNSSESPSTVARKVTFSASDGSSSGSAVRSINVVSVNDSPNLAPISSRAANIGQQIEFTVTATDLDVGDELTFLLDDESPATATLEQIDNNTAIVRWTPQPGDLPGPVPIGVLVVDNGVPPLADTESTLITLTSTVNTPPTFVLTTGHTSNEDAGVQTVPAFATSISPGGAGESSQTVSLQVTNNSNPSLFATPPALSADGTLTYTAAPNANGTATITVVAQDNGGTANGGDDTSDPQQFTITVTAVNDAPSFTLPPNHQVPVDSGAQTVPAFATAISPGPADEAAQTVTFQVTNNTNASLFSAAPALSADGTLTYTPAPGASGLATITVTATDNGGTANGGDDSSDSQQFT
ncbi:MAG: Ig-like domain-containing protein, partial [Pirellulales bacterium]